MGANYSPNIANLYLHFYESKCLHLNPCQGQLRYKFSFRFIDGLLTLNNRDSLYNVNSIYPKELKIINTNSEGHRNCSFLDMDIRIDNGRFVSGIYDKRRDFNFDILGLPSFNSYVPISMTYGLCVLSFVDLL